MGTPIDLNIDLKLRAELDIASDSQITWKVVEQTKDYTVFVGITDTTVHYKTVLSDSTIYARQAAEIRESKVFIREGTYQPEWFGLYLDGVKWLNVGFCQAWPDKGIDGFFVGELAHAHVNAGNICFSNGSYLFSDEGVLDDVFVHEYCHMLRGDTVYEEGHDLAWRNIAIKFGLEPIACSRYVYKS